MALGNTPISSALLAGRRRRSGNLFVKQQPSDAFPTIASAWVWGTAVSGAYTLTAQGGSYSVIGASATLTKTTNSPIIISTTALTLGFSSTPGAQAITVPADAQLAVVLSGVTTYNTVDSSVLAVTSSFTNAFTTLNPAGNRNTVAIGYAVINATGSQTITPVWDDTIQEGPTFWVVFIKNINPADFLRDIDSNATGAATGNATVTLTTSTTDLVLAIETQDVTIPSTISGFTSIASAVVTGELYDEASRVQTCNAPGSSTTTVTGTGSTYDGVAAIAIKYGVPVSGYTLTAQGGLYSLGGGSVVLKRDKLLIGSGGNYTLTGQNANLVKGRVLTAQAGAYSLTGASSNIYRSKRIVSTGGAYNLTGANANLLKSKVLVAQGGTYTYTGQSVTITYTAGTVNYTLTALGGSYALTGASALVSRNRVLTSSGGSYTYTGSSANLLRSKYLLSSGGSYSVTGASANILKSKVLVASAGAYTYTGGTATLLRSKYLKGSGGVYSLVGSSAILTWTGVGGAVWPPVHLVLLGTVYGPTGTEYTGTLDVNGIKYDITTGQLVKPINDKVVMSI